MSAVRNKQLMQAVFSELSKGNTRPFRDAMADDFSWTVTGSTRWSGTYRGKQTVLSELFAPLFAQFADRYTNTADRFIAEGDHVVVECRGRVTTRAGTPYNNTYCYVCRLSDGRLQELTEYFDTQLVATALAPPEVPGKGGSRPASGELWPPLPPPAGGVSAGIGGWARNGAAQIGNASGPAQAAAPSRARARTVRMTPR